MKKLLLSFVIVFILSGCAKNEDIVFEKINDVFENYIIPFDNRPNNSNLYYSYYLPNDIQELEYSDSYHSFRFCSSDFTMNLNVYNVINGTKNVDNYFDIIDDEIIYESKADDVFIVNYKDNYDFKLYKIDDKYLFSFVTTKMYCIGSTTLDDICPLVKHLLDLNNSIVIDSEKVLDDYYSGVRIDFEKEQINFLNPYVPTEGNLADLLPK